MRLRDYCEELRDSLDLVPIGAWHGNGRKVGWFSPFLLAAYDPDTEEFQSVCRCMSGYTDAFYAEVGARPSPSERIPLESIPSERIPSERTAADVCVKQHTAGWPESRGRQDDILQVWQEQT